MWLSFLLLKARSCDQAFFTAVLLLYLMIRSSTLSLSSRRPVFTDSSASTKSLTACSSSEILYALAQDTRQPWRNIWPGTMAALGAWLALNWLYSTYVENFADYSLLYGSIGTAIALLIWLYMTAVTLIMGAELNATLISLRKDRAGES